jgi:hypothetical protein
MTDANLLEEMDGLLEKYRPSTKKAKTEFTNVLTRIPSSVLERVDAKVKEKPWMTRTQWIIEALITKLDKEE